MLVCNMFILENESRPSILRLSVYRHSGHGPRTAGGLPHSPDQAAGRRRADLRAGRRPLPLLEGPASASEGEPTGPEPLGARPQGPFLEGGPPDGSRPRGSGPQRPGRAGGAGAGHSWTGETDVPLCLTCQCLKLTIYEPLQRFHTECLHKWTSYRFPSR